MKHCPSDHFIIVRIRLSSPNPAFCALSSSAITIVDVDNERGGADVKGERGVGRDTLEVWACSKRRGVRTSQVSAVRRVGRTSAVAVSLAGLDIDIAASVIAMRTQIGCRMCALHR